MTSARLLNLSLVVLLIVSTLGCSAAPASPTAAPTAAQAAVATPAPATATPPAKADGSQFGATPTLTPTPTQAPTSTPAATATPTVSPSPTPSGKVSADALNFSGGLGSAKGGVATFKVTVVKNDTRELRVGFFEQEVGGSGPMWRSSGWMAVIMSSFLLGIDPVDYTYTYDIGGRADGPSAGALMTVATIAALLGQQIKPDAAMTGTINPDGTIGPVGGIPQKIDGAADAKKTLVLVPTGARMSLDFNTNTMVDVVERGRLRGVTVKEVSDVYEAYELLIGKPLPKPPGLKEVRPDLPATAFDRTKGKAKEWLARYQQTNQLYSALPSASRVAFTNSMLADAKASIDKADKYFTEGSVSAAYAAATDAALSASVGYATSKMIEAYRNGGLTAVIRYASSYEAVNTKIDALQDRLRTQNVVTMSDTIAISDAYGWLNVGMGLSGLASGALKQKPANESEALGIVAEAAVYYAFADHAVSLAGDAIDLGMGSGTAPAPSEAKIASLAETFRRAAEANLTYFNSVVIDGYAQQFGVHPTVMQGVFAKVDMNYVFVYSSLGNIADIQTKAGPGVPSALAALGGALNSYVLSSGLVAKYYSLGVQIDKDGNTTGVSNERNMINMLDFADKRAKESIGLAVSLNTDPVQSVLYYDQAKIEREGDISAKFSALTDFWRAAMQAQAMAMLSGKANVVAPAK